MKIWSTVLVIVCVAGAAVLAVGVSTADSERATAETLRQLEADFMKAAADRGAEGYMSYYADDAVEVPDGADAIQGKANIAATMGFLNDKNNQLVWTPVYADISLAGDLGYTSGTYEFHSMDKADKPVVEHGKYTSIWKKQKDGSWKVVLDMGNASPGKK
jgi:ketosteroid isomerase-like protein